EVVDAGFLGGLAYRRIERLLAGFDETLRAVPVAVRPEQQEPRSVRGLAHDDDAGGKRGFRRHAPSIDVARTRPTRPCPEAASKRRAASARAAAIRPIRRRPAAPSRRRAPGR